MKILCLQLARFGDVFMTWPVLRAVKRQYPQAEIHGLFRERFVAAAQISGCVDHIHTVPAEQIFRHLLVESSVDKALTAVGAFSEGMQKHQFDLILNFSFSPLSSYLVESLKSEKTQVLGYQRHSDGFLNLADDLSRYFYAQVGPGRHNRIHVTDLMAVMAQVTLTPEDSQFHSSLKQKEILQKFGLYNTNYIVFHLGASEAHKCWSNEFWQLLILQFKTYCPEFHLVLIGSQEEQLLASTIEKSLHGERIVNLAGKTSWADLKDIFSASRLFVGADSGPMHLATVMQVPVLNLSLGQVNFWETGPRSNLGHVLRYNQESHANLQEIIQVARAMLTGQIPEIGFKGGWASPTFQSLQSYSDATLFEWNLLQAIYLGTNFPSTDRIPFVRAMQDLAELNRLALVAITKFTETKIDFLGPYLDRIYESMNVMAKSEPLIGIFVAWLRAEKCQVPPMDPKLLCKRYHEIHLHFRNLMNPYVLPADLKEDAHYG